MAAKKKTAKKKAAKKKTAPRPGRTRRNKPGAPNHNKGGAPKGNEFWKMRSTHGRKPIFDDPNQLWAACVEYFEWVEANPLIENKAFAYQGEAFDHPVAKMRPMTIGGLCIFLDITHPTWDDYRKNEDFSAICVQVEQIIREQKFAGAVADLMNPAIIARDLGLADKKELTGEGGGPITTMDITPDQYKEIARDISKDI